MACSRQLNIACDGMLRSMMLGMIRQVIVPLLLVAAMSAQDSQDLKVRIVFPEGLTEKASMTYLRLDAVQGHSRRYLGVTFQEGHSFVEVPATTERFRALVWAPGCKMKRFDVAVEKSDIELPYACDPLNTDPFYGRVKGVDGVPNPVITSALGVSVTYSVATRAGRRRPHPRHWQALAQLVGVEHSS